jgi:hypothetical protein
MIETERFADGQENSGPLARVTSLAQLLATLDRRVLEAFDTLDRIGSASGSLQRLTEDGEDLVADLRRRLDRLEARLHTDLDELKGAVLAKLDGLELGEVRGRFDALESSVQTIERAVTRVDGIVEGLVDTVPDFIARRVRLRADRVEHELESEVE